MEVSCIKYESTLIEAFIPGVAKRAAPKQPPRKRPTLGPQRLRRLTRLAWEIPTFSIPNCTVSPDLPCCAYVHSLRKSNMASSSHPDVPVIGASDDFDVVVAKLAR